MRLVCSGSLLRFPVRVAFLRIAFLLLGGQCMYAQTAGSDPAGSSARERIDSLLRLAKTYRMKGDRDGNLRAIGSARQLAEQASDRGRLTEVFAELSRQRLYDESFDLAKAFADSALLNARASGVPRAEAVAWLALTVYYNYLNARDLAVEHAQKALDILDEHEDPSLRARLYYALYGVYSSWDNTGLTLRYAQLCIAWARKAGDQDLLSNGYAARSVAMEMRFRESDAPVYLDSMLASLHRSAALFHEFPGKVNNTAYAIANVNIANYYFRYTPGFFPETEGNIRRQTHAAGPEILRLYSPEALGQGDSRYL